jgi:hypothetical protein
VCVCERERERARESVCAKRVREARANKRMWTPDTPSHSHTRIKGGQEPTSKIAGWDIMPEAESKEVLVEVSSEGSDPSAATSALATVQGRLRLASAAISRADCSASCSRSWRTSMSHAPLAPACVLCVYVCMYVFSIAFVLCRVLID